MPVRRALALIVVLVLAGGGFAAWQLTRSPAPTRVVAPVSDAAIEDAIEWGTVEIDPDPKSQLYIPPSRIDELSEPFGNSVHQTRSAP